MANQIIVNHWPIQYALFDNLRLDQLLMTIHLKSVYQNFADSSPQARVHPFGGLPVQSGFSGGPGKHVDAPNMV